MSTLYLESVELASEVRAILPRLAQRDPGLARRTRHSAEQLAAHAEESMLATGRTRRFELRAAQAAVVELLGCLQAADSNDYLEPGASALEGRLSALLDRLLGASDDTRRVPKAAGGARSGAKRAVEARVAAREQKQAG